MIKRVLIAKSDKKETTVMLSDSLQRSFAKISKVFESLSALTLPELTLVIAELERQETLAQSAKNPVKINCFFVQEDDNAKSQVLVHHLPELQALKMAIAEPTTTTTEPEINPYD